MPASVPPVLAQWMQPFTRDFTTAVWRHVLVLVTGTLLLPGRRTVTAVLRVLGLGHTSSFALYHRVLSTARWSSRVVAHHLLRLLVAAFVPRGPVVIGLDDTIERRWGLKIKARGIYRDPVRSSHGHFVKASGLRWLSLMLLAPVPWAASVWALPFLTVLAPSERYAAEQGRRHKRLTDPATSWRRVRITGWYGRTERDLDITSGTALWYHPGKQVAIRWVLVRDPLDEKDPQAFLCTDLQAKPVNILRWFVGRWRTETTFEEARRHLGMETQRQWSDLAILRTTPALLGLVSLVALGVGPAQPQRHQRKQAEQGRRGAQDRQIRPLSLGLQPEVTARFLKRRLRAPAAHEPAQDVDRIGLHVGAQKRLGLLLPGNVAHQHPADRHLPAGVVPQGCAGHDVEPALGPAIPAVDVDPLPGRGRVLEPVCQAWQPSALDPWPPDRTRLAPRGWLIKPGIEPQSRDHTEGLAHVSQQFDRREAAVRHGDDPPLRQPARGLQQHLTCPVGQPLVPPAVFPAPALRGREHDQERQTPDASGPGHRGQQHDAQPAQAAGLDEMAVAGADRIAVDAAGLDLRPPAPLDGVVDGDHDRTLRHEGGHEQEQEAMRDGTRGPACQAEHAMGERKAGTLP